MNDGSGFLKKRKCGGAFAFGLELADMDGDGDLDALVGAHEYGGFEKSIDFTGIVWNDGNGNFSQKTRYKQKEILHNLTHLIGPRQRWRLRYRHW